MIENAAREPEIADLADCLIKMGAKISGAGTSHHRDRGRARLTGARHRVLPDRIETGTYAMAVAMTGGDVLLEGARAGILQAALDVLAQAGVEITATNHGLRVTRNGDGLSAVEVTTEPFPGFPTDLQAQLMALMTRAKGTSRITETIFENRFMHVQELARLGARIQLDGETATIEGVERLKGAPVMATDLRASVSLVIAGARRRGRDHGQPRLSPRPRLRAAGGQARRLRRRDRAHQRLVSRVRQRGEGHAGHPDSPVARFRRSTGAANAQLTECRGGQKPQQVAELLFGRKIGDRIGVSEAIWTRFVDGEITPRFPDGLTVFNTVGQWRDSERKTIVREPSKIVMIVLPGKDDDIDRLEPDRRSLQEPVSAAVGRRHAAACLRLVLTMAENI